ncbi:hypothetical protein OG948_01610 [Embleya sp. NBC_00888]|uniref:hypothetical protein n=1 Tax=Embleya sp. NBC_00888 TaxID=2975960 RepID=UPI003863D849|nr:hypothetical protein OG948_01610 [Embleya sp. NBC_00888]
MSVKPTATLDEVTVLDGGVLDSLVLRGDYDMHKQFRHESVDDLKRLRVDPVSTRAIHHDRVPALVDAGADLLYIDPSDGYSVYQARVLEEVRSTADERSRNACAPGSGYRERVGRQEEWRRLESPCGGVDSLRITTAPADVRGLGSDDIVDLGDGISSSAGERSTLVKSCLPARRMLAHVPRPGRQIPVEDSASVGVGSEPAENAHVHPHHQSSALSPDGSWVEV